MGFVSIFKGSNGRFGISDSPANRPTEILKNSPQPSFAKSAGSGFSAVDPRRQYQTLVQGGENKIHHGPAKNDPYLEILDDPLLRRFR